MAQGDQNQDQKGLSLILWLVWGALVLSLFIYGATFLVIPAPADFHPPEIAAGTPPKLVVILSVASVVLIPLLFRVRKKMFFEPLGQECYPGSPEARSAYFTMSLTSWIMCEIVGIFGFAVYFLTYEVAYSIPFVVLGLVLMLMFWPDPGAAETGE